MDLDSKQLGRLRRVANARDVWISESGDFTPWLAENIDVLADELGMTLTVTGTEVQVGECRLDIRAEDHDGRIVVIENQLERTDHSHLGQCLVYASGLDASTVVWVAVKFRDDFRRALDWLNERTDLNVSFFGVEVGVVQIGETGPRAPVFDVVARPNDWQKGVKAAATGSAAADPAAVTPLNARRQDLFAAILTEVVQSVPSIRMPARSRQNWLSFASGPFGYWALSFASDSRLRVEAYLDSGDQTVNKALFDEMAGSAAQIQEAAGTPLEWERLDARRASRIAAYRAVDLDDPASVDDTTSWATATLLQLFGRLNDTLRQRAKALKQAQEATLEKQAAEAHDSGDPASD